MGFILFSALSVLSAGMFAVNLGATMMMEPTRKKSGNPPPPRKPSLPQPHHRPPRRRSIRTCGWRDPHPVAQTVDRLRGHGFASLRTRSTASR